MASGTLPSNEKNVTRTGRVFCNMKMTKTINRTAAIQIPTQTAQRANVVSRDRSRNTGLRGGGARLPGCDLWAGRPVVGWPSWPPLWMIQRSHT
jgi:hypothetical protein